MKKNNQNVSNGMKFFIVVVSLVIIITITFLAGYTFGKGDKNLCQVTDTKFGKIETQVKRTPISEIYQRVGLVTEKGSDFVTINSQINPYGFGGGEAAEYVDFKAKITPETKIIKIISLKNGDENQEEIKFSDIETKKTVKVVSVENIKDKAEFTATKIYLITDEK